MKVYIGIDWSKDKHNVGILNEAGEPITQLCLPHSLEGFGQMEQVCQKLGSSPEECWVGMETAHNLLIDFLWDHHYPNIFVLPPAKTKAERPSVHLSGAYNDASDAFLIASLLRTKPAAFNPWFPDGLLIRQMRTIVSTMMYLTKQTTRTSNRLTSVLNRYYPAALQVFSGLQTFVTLAFIQAYPTPQAAAELSLEAFVAFVKQHRYPNHSRLPGCYARLQQPRPLALKAVETAYPREAVLLAQMLEQQMKAKNDLLKELTRLFQQHPDRAVFVSLPGVGQWLAPALLAKLGEDRKRFPQAAHLQAIAGTCPVTQESGKHRRVTFRHACDHELRQIVQQWAAAERISLRLGCRVLLSHLAALRFREPGLSQSGQSLAEDLVEVVAGSPGVRQILSTSSRSLHANNPNQPKNPERCTRPGAARANGTRQTASIAGASSHRTGPGQGRRSSGSRAKRSLDRVDDGKIIASKKRFGGGFTGAGN